MRVEIHGLTELNKKFEKLTGSLDADRVEPITHSGAKIMAAEMERQAPEGPTGNLKAAIRTVKLKRDGDRPAPSIAGVDRKKAPHAHLVEFGTSTRRVKEKQVLYDAKTGRFFGKEVGDMPANPFVRRSLQAKEKEVIEHVVSGIQKLIEEGVK